MASSLLLNATDHFLLNGNGDRLLLDGPTTPTPAGTGWWGAVVTRWGDLVAELDPINVRGITFRLNQPAEAVFSLPKSAATTATIELGESEVQIYEDGTLRFWGLVVTDDADSGRGEVTFGAKDPLFYLTRGRLLGRAQAENQLTDGGFESGVGSWTASAGATISQSAVRAIKGTKSLKVVGTAGGNTYAGDTFAVATPSAAGQQITVTGWVWVDDATFTSPAFDGRGLWVGFYDSGFNLTHDAVYEIDDALERDAWNFVEVKIRYEEAGTIGVRLYSSGDWWWDDIRATKLESTSTATGGSDQTEAFRRVLSYALSKGSALNIATSTAASGITRFRTWKHYKRQRVEEVLAEFPDLEDGFDFSCQLTSTTRTITTHYPRQGTDRRGSFTLQAGVNLERWSTRGDATKLANSVTAQADEGSGSGIVAAGWEDTDDLGGVVWEDLIQAPDEAMPAELEGIAYQEWRRRHLPDRTVDATVKGTAKDSLALGDIVDLVIADGYVQVNDDRRVTARTINGDQSVTVALERWLDP